VRAATRAPLRVNAASKPYDVPLNLTTWCLEQERLGIIDNELAVVITSIASSCKRVRLARYIRPRERRIHPTAPTLRVGVCERRRAEST
jgi:hypothetical protein